MTLKCPICGKEYYYDRKICQVCESKSIYSGLIANERNATQKWNCGIFLESDTLTFSRHKLSDRYIKINSEPKYSDFKLKKGLRWNCEPDLRFRTFYILKSEVAKLRNSRNLPNNDLYVMKKEANNSILYE